MIIARPKPRLWPVLLGLGVFALTPFAGSLTRGIWLLNDPEASSAFEAAVIQRPVGLMLHAVAAALFTGLGAVQITPGIRVRFPRWHRKLGYVAWGAGLVMAASGLWLVAAYPWAEGSGAWAQVVRGIAALAMGYWLIAALKAARAGDVLRHRARMIRAFVIAVGATTNALLIAIWMGFGLDLTANAFAGLMAAGWLALLVGVELRYVRRPGDDQRVTS